MKRKILMKYGFFILVIGTLLACGCMESGNPTIRGEGSTSFRGEWIILPATDLWDEFSGSSITSSKQTGDYQGLVIYTVPDNIRTGSGENVSIDVILGNTGEAPIVIEDYPPAFFIKDPADLSNQARITRRYLRGDETVTIEPGEKVIHTIKWDQRNDRGFRVAPAIYVLEIADVIHYDGERESMYRGAMGREIAEITVRPEGGSLERSVVANQPVTNETITITLESINAKADYIELLFSAYAVGPDYVAVMDDGREWTHVLSPEYEPLRGFYQIDDGEIRYLWKVESTGGQDYHYGYRGIIEPLPADVRNISVKIDGFGPISGLWEYHITF